MGKIRSIHPEACDNEKLAKLSDGAERTLWRLATQSDDHGRGVDNPKLISAKLYPLNDEIGADTIDAQLWELSDAGMVVRYEASGKFYYEIHDFTDWQKPRHFTPSKLPPSSDGSVRTSDTQTPMSDAPETDVGHESEDRPASGVGGGGGSGGGEERDADASRLNPDPMADLIDEQFEDFWERYPRHRTSRKPGGGASRKKAREKWGRLGGDERRDALAAVDNYREWCERPEGEFPAHATTWINEQRWEQWQEAAPSNVTAIGNGQLPYNHPLREGGVT